MQLKRNKEMEFETLKKSHKKQIVIGALVVCILGGALTFNLTIAKYKITESIDLAKGTINYKQYDFKIMAMYKSDDNTNYNEINDMPNSGYIINEEKTYCTTDNKTQVKGKIKTENGKHYITGLSKNDKCYLYFDKKTGINNASELLTKVQSEAKTTPDFSQAATTDEGIYTTEDGMYGGVSYYWRGAVTNNYLQFAGFCWRIVRINGDKTIRLIYDGSTCHQNGESTTDSIAKPNVAYNLNNSQSNNVGWTYEGQLQRPKSNTSETESYAKSRIESWYSSSISEADTNKIAQGEYCNNRSVGAAPSIWGDGYVTKWSINGTKFAYTGAKRLHETYSPTLSCPSGDVYILNVGLITADEVEFAGGKNEENTSYYLYNGNTYWTMTPLGWKNKGAEMFYVSSDGYLGFYRWSSGSLGLGDVDKGFGLRPVINLRSDVTFSSGDGTLNNPYVVE